MRPQALEVFKILECTHGVSGAQTIIEYVENTDHMAIERVLDGKLEHLATKRDVAAVREELSIVRNDLSSFKEEVKNEFTTVRNEFRAVRNEISLFKDEVRNEISLFKDEVRNEFKTVRNEAFLFRDEVKNEFAMVRTEMANVKADLMKWMFVFWVSQVITTFGFILLFIKK